MTKREQQGNDQTVIPKKKEISEIIHYRRHHP